MKRILVIHTGGTIAMKEDKQAGGISLDTEHPLASFQSQLEMLALITTEQFTNLPSAHIAPENVIKLSQHIQKRVSEESFDGIVITHGTDTMEETAYMLHLLQPCQVPLVLTGAMKSSNELGADGPNNLISAVRVAICNEAKETGVLVVMDDVIHTAKYVTKTHTSSVAAFESPMAGPAGIVTKQDVIFFYKPKLEMRFHVNKLEKKVVLLKCYSGMENDVLQAIEKINVDGLVIEAFGQGNVPPLIVPTIKQFISNHIPVVLVSRSLNGVVQPTYDYEGGGKQLKELGVIFSKELTGQKARIKLLLALHKVQSHNELNIYF